MGSKGRGALEAGAQQAAPGQVIQRAAAGQALLTAGGRLCTWGATPQTRQLRADVRPDFGLAGREAITLQFVQGVVRLG